jgi:aerobic C4-dicarboxylate transport protein
MNETVTRFSPPATLFAGCSSGSRPRNYPRRTTYHEESVMSLPVAPVSAPPPAAKRRDRTHYLYIAVIAAVVAGVVVGLAAPSVAVQFKPLGTAFVALIKMMISPVIFCTIVLGIGSIRKAAKVGKVGGLALGYFVVMSTIALAIGLVVGNLLHPGAGLHLSDAARKAAASAASTAHGSGSTVDFLLGMIPTTLVSSLTSGVVLQTLLVALLAGFALQGLGRSGEVILAGIKHF